MCLQTLKKKQFGILASFIFSFLSSCVWASVQTPPQTQAIPRLEPESQHAVSAQRITNLFSRTHYKRFEFDETLASEVFARYIEFLDAHRFFFLQEDVTILSRYEKEFAEHLRRGRLEPAYEIFNLNIERRNQRFAYVLHLLNTEKLSALRVGKTYRVDRKDTPWQTGVDALNQVWKKRLVHEYLDLKLANKTEAQILETLKNRYTYAQKRLYQNESEDAFELVMNAFAKTVEEHTRYLSPVNSDKFGMDMSLSLEGIGAVLQDEDGHIVIRSLVVGGPAALSKQLKAKDKIIAVAQEKQDFVDVTGWRLDHVVKLIKGPKGSVVRLEIVRDSEGPKPKIIEITRDQVHLDDRAARSEILQAGRKKVGILNVPSFYVDVHKDVKKELEFLNQEGVEGLVVDLRENGGGELGEATSLTGLFIKSGPVVQIRDAAGRITQNVDRDKKIYFDKPIVVLVSPQSASASEIFAAALQDYGRALIVGEHTFGKGTVQQHRGLGRIYDFYKKPLGHVQYTIAKFYRVNGDSTQHKGVHPDIVFPSLNPPEETGESIMKKALPWDKIEPTTYTKHGEIAQYKEVLVQKHSVRIAQDKEFLFLKKDIQEHRKNKQNKNVSLLEAERLADMKRKEQQMLDRLNQRLTSQGFKPVKSVKNTPEGFIAPDPYLKEATQILSDFIEVTLDFSAKTQ